MSLKSRWSLRRDADVQSDVYISTCKLMLKVVRLVGVCTTAVHSRNNCVINESRGEEKEMKYVLYVIHLQRVKLLEKISRNFQIEVNLLPF